jgi:hypothetical protein
LKISASVKAKWEDPDYRARVTAGIQESWVRAPREGRPRKPKASDEDLIQRELRQHEQQELLTERMGKLLEAKELLKSLDSVVEDINESVRFSGLHMLRC